VKDGYWGRFSRSEYPSVGEVCWVHLYRDPHDHLQLVGTYVGEGKFRDWQFGILNGIADRIDDYEPLAWHPAKNSPQ
jgi:hypothetical protein